MEIDKNKNDRLEIDNSYKYFEEYKTKQEELLDRNKNELTIQKDEVNRLKKE